MAFKKYIFKKAMSLGGIRTSVSKGEVVEYDQTTGRVKLRGKTYENDVDVIISLNHDWLVKWTKKVEQEIKGSSEPKNLVKEKPFKSEVPRMKIIKSDQDLIEPIDISHTKVQPKEAKKKNDSNEMEIIDSREYTKELPEEALSSKVRQERNKKAKRNEDGSVRGMKVISEEESGEMIGVGASKSNTSLNKGQVKTISKSENEKSRTEAKQRADSIKKGLDRGRPSNHPDKAKKGKKAVKKATGKKRGRPPKRIPVTTLDKS